MDEYYRLKTTRTKQRQPHNGTPQRGDKRKEWKRSDKRNQRDE